MDYVTIRGKDLNDCLMQMKMKYGTDAHVYEKRVVTEGGILGTGLLANKYYEIKVGIPEKADTREVVEKKLNDLRELLRKKSAQKEKNSPTEPKEEEKPDFRKKSSVLSSHKSRRREIPSFSEWVLEEGSSWEEGYPEGDLDPSPDPNPEFSGISFAREWIHREKETPAPFDHHTPFRDSFSPGLRKLESKLVQEGMSPDYVADLVKETSLHLSPVDRGRYSVILEKCVEILANRIQVDLDLFSGTGKGKRKVLFLIGPTGSGKTTTLAKLAAKYFHHLGRTVSLYTTDNYRIAAIEQLKRYADIMDLPFCPVKEVKKFREALLRDGSELVLVDTAGYSHKDKETLKKMKEYYEALGEKDQLENILVVSATVSSKNARQVLESYGDLGYSRIILTKLDETDYLGSFVELADIFRKEFAYLCVGQDVPFDILGAEKKLLAECVVYPEKMEGIKGEVFSKKS